MRAQEWGLGRGKERVPSRWLESLLVMGGAPAFSWGSGSCGGGWGVDSETARRLVGPRLRLGSQGGGSPPAGEVAQELEAG